MPQTELESVSGEELDLMCHLQRFSSFEQDPILSSDPGGHHHSCRGGQPQGAGASNGQNRDGCLKCEADDDLRSGDVLFVTL